MKTTEIAWRIESDGTVTIETGDCSGENHLAADDLLKQLAEVLGGEVKSAKRSRTYLRTDLSGALRAHAHDGHVHTH